jgi:hypothetical protein
LRGGAALAGVAVVLAGCGGGGGLDKTVSAGPPPEPEESISAFAGRLASAVEAGRQGKCRELKALSVQLNCNPRARRAFAGFKVTGTATYGTGGVVEFVNAETRDPKGVTPSARGARGVYTVALDPRGRWAFTGSVLPVLPGPTIGTRPAGVAGARRAARQFVTAVRRSDCSLFYRVTFTPGQERQQACAIGLGEYAPLAQQLRDHSDASPRPLGGNAVFAFFGLWTGDQYRTVVVFRSAPSEPYLVMGALKGPS